MGQHRKENHNMGDTGEYTNGRDRWKSGGRNALLRQEKELLDEKAALIKRQDEVMKTLREVQEKLSKHNS